MRDAIVAEARRWVGTPYAHQACAMGLGVDCVGLVLGVALACGLVSQAWADEHGPRIAAHGRQPSGDMLQAECDRWMTRINIAEPGDVLLLRFRREPRHLAIVTGGAVVHALHGHGVRRVVEHRLAAPWVERIVQAYRLPGVV